MTDPNSPRWSQADVEESLAAVREALLGFLHQRTRLDWFKHRVRWRKSRRYIWPGAPDAAAALLDEAVEGDAGVQAFVEHMQSQQAAIVDAIERYNTALRRHLEEARGVPAARFDVAAQTELRQRRITFQGARDELLRRARGMLTDTAVDLVPELLSLRLAILTEDVRDEIFREVASILADEVTDYGAEMPAGERVRLAEAFEVRLRSLDRYHVARLLAENYAEARRMMDLDGLSRRYERLAGQRREGQAVGPGNAVLLDALHGVLTCMTDFLEELFPQSAATHDRERALLRRLGSGESVEG